MKTGIVFATLAAASFWTSTAVAANLSEWRRDIEAIVREIESTHPNPFTKTGELTWRRDAAALTAELPMLGEEERLVGLMKLVAKLGDGHTGIVPESARYSLWYPFRLYEFSDGFFVTSAHKSQTDLAGAEVLAIGGKPVDAVVNEARSLFGADNFFDAKERLFAVHNAFLMKGLGFAQADGALSVTFRLRDGNDVTRKLKARQADEIRLPSDTPIFDWDYLPEVYGMPFGSHEDWFSAMDGLPAKAFAELDTSRPPVHQQKTAGTKRALPEQDAYYVQISYTTDSTMGGLMSQALSDVDALKPRRFIIDIRYNIGGDGSTLTNMIHGFISREENPPWKELYVITGRKTFSAGVMAIDAFLDHTEATFVGEPAGAALNSYGDAVSRPYPALGLSLSVSTLRHQLSESNDLSKYTRIDVPALMSFENYVAGGDPALDPILAGEEMRSIPAIARTAGGGAARRAHLDRAARFGDRDWFKPPSELAFRNVIDELTAQERYEDAIETAKLTTEIHPHLWNAWYGLAKVEEAAGREKASFASYQCVLELDPNNYNAPEILELFSKRRVKPKPAPGCPAGGR